MTNLPERMSHRDLRAADADRERVAAVLRDAAAEGRLDLSELDDRLGLVYAAKTYGDLEPLLRDLPGVLDAPVSPPGLDPPAAYPPASRGGVAIFSEFTRKGRWSAAGVFKALALFGGGTVDLREALLTGGEVRIRAFAIFGGVDVIVPEEATVHITGIGIMGGFDQAASGAGQPGAPRVTISGLALFGGVSVRRRPSREEEKRRKAERKRRQLEG